VFTTRRYTNPRLPYLCLTVTLLVDTRITRLHCPGTILVVLWIILRICKRYKHVFFLSFTRTSCTTRDGNLNTLGSAIVAVTDRCDDRFIRCGDQVVVWSRRITSSPNDEISIRCGFAVQLVVKQMYNVSTCRGVLNLLQQPQQVHSVQCESKKYPPPKTFCDIFSYGEPV